MLRLSRNDRITAVDFAALERRIEDLERRLMRLTRLAGRASSGVASSVSDTTERIGDAIASALSEITGGARSFGSEAARLRAGAARAGSDALRRLSAEVEHRPLVLLAVAAGIGLLVGLAARRR